MQYLLSVIDDTADLATPDETAVVGDPNPESRMLDAFNDRLVAEGYWVFSGGLAAPGTATVIDNRGGDAVFTDGPFVESKEYLGGLWIIEAADLDVALKLAAEGSKACNRRVEVRPFACPGSTPSPCRAQRNPSCSRAPDQLGRVDQTVGESPLAVGAGDAA